MICVAEMTFNAGVCLIGSILNLGTGQKQLLLQTEKGENELKSLRFRDSLLQAWAALPRGSAPSPAWLESSSICTGEGGEGIWGQASR